MERRLEVSTFQRSLISISVVSTGAFRNYCNYEKKFYLVNPAKIHKSYSRVTMEPQSAYFSLERIFIMIKITKDARPSKKSLEESIMKKEKRKVWNRVNEEYI